MLKLSPSSLFRYIYPPLGVRVSRASSALSNVNFTSFSRMVVDVYSESKDFKLPAIVPFRLGHPTPI